VEIPNDSLMFPYQQEFHGTIQEEQYEEDQYIEEEYD
jgi:hypothetical protein